MTSCDDFSLHKCFKSPVLLLIQNKTKLGNCSIIYNVLDAKPEPTLTK